MWYYFRCSSRDDYDPPKMVDVVSMHSPRNKTMIFGCHGIHKPVRHKLMFLKWYAYHLFFLQRHNYDVDGPLKSNCPQTYSCFKKLHRTDRSFYVCNNELRNATALNQFNKQKSRKSKFALKKTTFLHQIPNEKRTCECSFTFNKLII